MILVWVLATALAAATLVWSSGSDMFIGMLLLVVVGGWGALALWGVASFVRAARGRAPGWLRAWAVAWAGGMALCTLSVGLGATGVPEDVRVALSRDALVGAGEEVLTGGQPRRAGLYGFSRTSVAGGCAFLETGTFAIESFGIAYCPDGRLQGGEPLGGGLFTYSFD